MGQIVSNKAKPKRCNLNKLSQLGTPAAGEYILVSSDNSMNAAGQGNFDCYIVGNGRDAATALPLNSLADAVPTNGSKNSVTSGGMYNIIYGIDESKSVSINTTAGAAVTSNTARDLSLVGEEPYLLALGGDRSNGTGVYIYFKDSDGGAVKLKTATTKEGLASASYANNKYLTNESALWVMAEKDVSRMTFYAGATSVKDTTTLTYTFTRQEPNDVVLKTDIEDTLTSTDASKVLSAAQGKNLNDKVDQGIASLENSIFKTNSKSNNFTSGKLVNGVITNDDAFYTTDYIELPAHDSTYTLLWEWGKTYSADSVLQVALYDASKNYISSYSETKNTTSRTFRPSANQPVKFVRMTFEASMMFSTVLVNNVNPSEVFFEMNDIASLKTRTDSISSSVAEIGIHKIQVTDYDAAGIKVIVSDVALKAGDVIDLKISTNKSFTRFIVGFNPTYDSTYHDYNNNNTVIVVPVDTQNVYGRLFTADDFDQNITAELRSGYFFPGGDDYDEDFVVMPSTIFAMDGVENSIYHNNYKKWDANKYIVGPTLTFRSAWNYLARCFRTTGGLASDAVFDFSVFSRETMRRIKRFQIPIHSGVVSGSESAKVVNVIGDSFTYNGTWYKQIYDVCPNLSFVGMRKSYECQDPLRGEGRGGWTLSNYFEPYNDVTPNHMQPFSPFMHVNGYTYYGVIDFWKVIVNNNSQYTYGTDGFNDYVNWFDTNGYKKNPSANDLMYDGVNDKYVYWNGSAWADFNGTPTFAFDYAKYLSTWNITSPNFVVFMLGKNDFQSSATEEVFNTWKALMDEAIASIHSYNANINVLICTPTTANETPNNTDNNIPEYGGRNMWLARKQIIEYYDNSSMQGNNVYVVDSGVCLDPLFGFPLQEMKPFTFYDGDNKELISTNGVHPSVAGYKQIGTCVAGAIQYLRNL